jgi:hypothetical protein
MRPCVAAGVVWMAIAAVAMADDVPAAISKPTNIPAQGLGSALKFLAKDRNLQIIYASEEIGERRTQGAVGELVAEDALKQLLQGTGLTFKYLDDKTVTIVSITSAASPSSGEDSEESEETDEPDEPSSNTAQGVRSEAAFEPTPLPQVTVEAERQALRKRIAHFVRTMTTQVSSYESLPRWGVKVCPAVTGLPAPQGEFILQRISSIARWAGITLGAEDCKPNLWVTVTSEPFRLVKQMWSHDPGRFADLSGQPATATQMHRFLDDPRPIRVWHGAELVGAMGNELGPYENMPQQARAPKVNTMPRMSRIQIDDLQVIKSTLVIVDKRRVVGLKLGALADYVAMVGLAAVNPDGDYASAESILNLFAAPQKGQSIDQLSAWDAGFLKALYATDQSSKLQVSAILNKMNSDPGITPLTPAAARP